MASTSSSTPRSIQAPPTVKKINDALYELYRPATGFIEIEIIFFHGLRAGDYSEAYLKTWMLTDHSECWLNTLLAEDFPRARILSVTYDSSTHVSNSTGRMDMHNVGENLAQSLIGLAGIGQSCPVVLVGHSIGGLVLKQFCLQVEQMAATHMGPGINRYKTFLRNMKLAFFYSTPNLGSRVMLASKQRGPLLHYLEELSKDAARLNSSFAKLRQRLQHGWKTCGVAESDETEACRSNVQTPHLTSRLFNSHPQYSLEVEEGSARYDMDEIFFLSGEDNVSICKPKDRSSSNYQYLVQVAQEVLQIEESLKAHWRSSLRMPRKPVDMSWRVEQVIKSLALSSRLALVGMGGIGKTTLAKAVLMEIWRNFDLVCFVDDVKRKLKSQSENLHYLMADNLYLGTGSKLHISDCGAQSLWLHLRGKKVLLIMDDVDSEDPLDSLLEDNWLGERSRVVITSRIRSKADLSKFEMFKVPFLSKEHAKELFLAHLHEDVIRIVPEDLIEGVVRRCDGLPLTVEVISKYLKPHKTVGIWKSALNKLIEAESLDGSQDDRLWKKLKVSIDDLAKLERKMFLDIAVFDEAIDIEAWEAAWESGVDGSSVRSGWWNLIDRSLIGLQYANCKLEPSDIAASAYDTACFYMHQQLRDLGKRVSRSSDKIELCTASWRQEDVVNLLNNYKGDEAQTEIVSVSFDRIKAPLAVHKSYPWSSIARLQELRLLRLSKVNMGGNESLRFPFKLRFLHLRSCVEDSNRKFHVNIFRSKCWPIREQDVEEGLQQLSVLILDEKCTVRFPWNFHKLTNLKILIVRGTRLEELPDKFGRLPALRRLILKDVQGLSRLPSSFPQLSSLRTLTLEGCPLTTAEIGLTPQLARQTLKAPRPLSSLTILNLVDLHKLTELPGTFGSLESLKFLSIVRCSALKELPEGFGKLSNLQRLCIIDCVRLKSLSKSFVDLGSLRELSIWCCPCLGPLGSLIYTRLCEEYRHFDFLIFEGLGEEYLDIDYDRDLSHVCFEWIVRYIRQGSEAFPVLEANLLGSMNFQSDSPESLKEFVRQLQLDQLSSDLRFWNSLGSLLETHICRESMVYVEWLPVHRKHLVWARSLVQSILPDRDYWLFNLGQFKIKIQ